MGKRSSTICRICVTWAFLVSCTATAAAQSYRSADGRQLSKTGTAAIKEYEALLPLAKGGSADAQYKLAEMLVKGIGVKKNELEGAKWCRAAAEKGYVPAECQLGRLYEDGIGVRDDINQALHWLQLACNHGSAQAAYELSGIYASGMAGPGGDQKAVKYCRLAAERGLPAGEHLLGDIYRMGKLAQVNCKEALKWYLKAADDGDPEALYFIGNLYYEGGSGVTPNHKAAAAVYLQLFERKEGGFYSLAARRLADMYHTGDGLEKNDVLARKFLRASQVLNSRDERLNSELMPAQAP